MQLQLPLLTMLAWIVARCAGAKVNAVAGKMTKARVSVPLMRNAPVYRSESCCTAPAGAIPGADHVAAAPRPHAARLPGGLLQDYNNVNVLPSRPQLRCCDRTAMVARLDHGQTQHFRHAFGGAQQMPTGSRCSVVLQT